MSIETDVAVAWRGVTKVHGTGSAAVTALRDLDLAVAPGELVAVLGPSGSGKSTLIHLGAGLDLPSAGVVEVAGRVLSDLSAEELARHRRLHIGVVFQRLNLMPSLSAAENVALPLELDGMRRRPARDAARAALEQVGMAHTADRYPDDLSGGEQQRVAVARAIVGDRTVVLADEPTGALDTANADAIVELLARLAAAGTAVVLVTHDPRFASWADRVVVVRDGAVVDTTSPAPAGRR